MTLNSPSSFARCTNSGGAAGVTRIALASGPRAVHGRHDVVNALEDGDRTCIDLVLHPDPEIVVRLRTESLETRGFPELAPTIARWSVRAGSDAATAEVLVERGFEFPQLSYRKHDGQRYRVAFGARIQGSSGAEAALVRFDHESGERTFERAGFVFGEPLFVAPRCRCPSRSASMLILSSLKYGPAVSVAGGASRGVRHLARNYSPGAQQIALASTASKTRLR